MYYIISLCHTSKRDDYLTLWRANNAGYCYAKYMAGLYENPEKGYHDSDLNMPIKQELAEKLMIETIHDGRIGYRILNCKQVWERLGLKMTKDGLRKKG